MTAALRRHATTLVLTVLALAAVVVVWGYDRGWVSTDEAERRKKNLFEAWHKDDVSEVVVDTGGKHARLVRKPADAAGTRAWDVETEGQRYPGDEQAIDDFLGKLEFAEADRRIAEGAVNRAGFGLDAPRSTVHVVMGKLTFGLAIGGPAPTPEGARYAEVTGSSPRVCVITKQLADSLDVDVTKFRSKDLVPYVSTELEAIALDGSGGPRHLVRAPWSGAHGAGFRFDGTTPEGKVRAHAEAVDRLLTTLARMQAELYLDPARASAAATREVTVVLRPKDASRPPAVLEVGGACPDRPELVVAVRKAPVPAAACVAKSALEVLSVPAADLVDHGLVGADVDAILELKIDAGGAVTELARSGSGWHVRHPFDRDVPADIGRDVVEALRKVAAERFVGGGDLGALGLSPPRATVRVVSLAAPEGGADAGDAERIEQLEVGAPLRDVVYVRRVEDGAIAAVNREDAGGIVPSELALRPRKVVDEPAKRFTSLRITAGGVVQAVRRNEHGGWDLVEPTGRGLSADIGLASDVADVLGSLTAERWAAPRDDGSYGLAKPRIVIEAELDSDASGDAGAPSTLRFEIGAPVASGGAFARKSGDEAVFVAPKSLETVASRLLLNRMSLRFDGASIQTITLEARGKRTRIERSGESWKIAARPSGASGADDPARAAAVTSALTEMMAEQAASIGKPKPDQHLDAPELTVRVDRSSGEPRSVRLFIGAGDTLRGTSIYYVRRDDIDATFAVPQSAIVPLLDALK